jgi:UDP-glucose 4-epimerase
LITGGCGFIGCNLIRHLVAEGGHRLRVLDNLEVGRRERLEAFGPVVEMAPAACATEPAPDHIELIVADILDADAVRAATRGCDVVVHFAANTGVPASVRDPRPDCLVNVVGTLNCLEAARAERIKRFVFASSAAPVGKVEPPVHEEKAPHPVSPYGGQQAERRRLLLRLLPDLRSGHRGPSLRQCLWRRFGSQDERSRDLHQASAGGRGSRDLR